MQQPLGKESEVGAGATSSSLDAGRLWELIQVGRSLVAELDMERLIGELLDVARRVTGARYAAVGILDERRTELERFITRGIDDDLHREIGDLPRGRGILGLLIADPKPLRLRRIGDHPKSYGFPPAHPPMRSFLGVPILIRNEAFGNLYLTDKEGGEFDEADEQAAVILAAWTAIAVENARLYGEASAQRDELERANRGLEAITTVSEPKRISRCSSTSSSSGRAHSSTRARWSSGSSRTTSWSPRLTPGRPRRAGPRRGSR
jgi:signal transduction protein with GAF and PtsI domain